MGDILRLTGPAVRGKDAGNEIGLLGDPQAHHRFGPESTGRAAPDILAFQAPSGLIGRMLELACLRQMVSPRLGALCQIVVPAQRRHPGKRAFAVVAVENADVEVAKAGLRARQQRHGGSNQCELPRRYDDASHSISPNDRGLICADALRSRGGICLRRR